MRIKSLFRNKVILILMLITALALSGIVFTSIRSLNIDKEHLSLLEHSKDIDIEMSHCRVYLDDYYFLSDTHKKEKILESFERVSTNLSSLSSFAIEKFGRVEGENDSDFYKAISKVNKHTEQLQSLIINEFQKESQSIDSVVLKEFDHFQVSYLEFDKSVHDYILAENSSFKREIFILLLSVFGVFLLCIILIIKLINAFHSIERQQADKTINIEYKERKRIAVDLHDGLGSILSSIVLFVKLIEKESDNQKISSNLNQVKQLSNMALENLEASINNLNPSMLNKYGLIKSLEIICEKINGIGKINCKIDAQNYNIELNKNMEINIYRICNELIHNTVKHAEASELEIHFKNNKKRVTVSYYDNGKGFNPDLIPSNKDEKVGLRNIISRIESFNGTFSINSGPGKGLEFFIHFNV